MKVTQSHISEFRLADSYEERRFKETLTFRVKEFGNKETILKLYEKLGSNHYLAPRFAHTLFETKKKRLDITRKRMVSKPVKFPKFLLSLREEQQKAADAYFENPDDNLLVLPPASGKTILAAYIASKLGERTMILVHRGAFFNVWKKDITKAFGLKPSDIGEVRAGKFKIGKLFTIATFQTLYSREYEDLYDQFGLVIADECLVGDTLVEMLDGTRKPIRNIRDGDEVVGGTVTNKFKKLVHTTVRVTTKDGKSFEASKSHPILRVVVKSVMNGMMERYDLERVRTDSLRSGDLLAVRSSTKLALKHNKERDKDGDMLDHPIIFHGTVPFRLVEVDKLETIEKSRIVYDFTTTSHTFIANGFLTSNCHRVPAETFSYVTSQFQAKHMMGVTGTYEREDGLHLLSNLFLGRIAYYNTDSDLDHVEMANIYRLDTDINIPLNKGENVHHMYHKLLVSPDRFDLFADVFNECFKAGRKQLVFTHSTTYARLYASLLNLLGYKVGMLIGGQDKKNAVTKELMLSGTLDAVIATVQYLKEGESINNLDTVHLLTPVGNKTDWYQSIARGTRKHEGKKSVLILDYVDNLVARTLKSYENRKEWSGRNNAHTYHTQSLTDEAIKN